MNIKDNLSQMLEDAQITEQTTTWQERFAATLKSDEGLRIFLDVLAEHPGYSLYNINSVMTYRLLTGANDTRELLSYEEAQKLGGHVKHGARGIPIVAPTKDESGHISFATKFVFPASVCINLDPHRYRGHNRKVHDDNSESIKMFMEATDKVDFNKLDEVTIYIISKRYGFSVDDEPAPTIDTTTLDELLERCNTISDQLKNACKAIDASLYEQAHPEELIQEKSKSEKVDFSTNESIQPSQPTANEVMEAAQRASVKQNNQSTKTLNHSV